jgi:plastocyanin
MTKSVKRQTIYRYVTAFAFMCVLGFASVLLDRTRTALSVTTADAVVNFPGFVYNPGVVTITVGERVTWNGDFGFHPLRQVTDATGDTPVSGGFASSSGSTFQHQFTSAGTFYYQCVAHGTFGGSMRGEVRVIGGSAATATPGTTTTPSPSATPTQTNSVPSCVSFDAPFGPENPSITTTASGRAYVVVNTVANELAYVISYTNLSSVETNAHFHAFTPPASAGPPIAGQPLTAGTAPKIGIWKYNSEIIEADILAGRVYVNIHTANNTGGEIRANLVNPAVCKRTFLPTTIKGG